MPSSQTKNRQRRWQRRKQARPGKTSYVALAQAAQLPAVRVRGLMSGLRRIMNVDGVPLLTLDETEGFAELNTQLLAKQFRIERP